MKGMKNPHANVNDTGKEPVANIVPGKNSPMTNEETTDTSPDHPPAIPWPKAVAVDHKPMKLK